MTVPYSRTQINGHKPKKAAELVVKVVCIKHKFICWVEPDTGRYPQLYLQCWTWVGIAACNNSSREASPPATTLQSGPVSPPLLVESPGSSVLFEA